jgi:hypothetical protein
MSLMVATEGISGDGYLWMFREGFYSILEKPFIVDVWRVATRVFCV